MTLLATEIHRHDNRDAMIIFAADRRISRNGVRDGERRKVFPETGTSVLPRSRAALRVGPRQSGFRRSLAGRSAPTLEALATDLAEALNRSRFGMPSLCGCSPLFRARQTRSSVVWRSVLPANE